MIFYKKYTELNDFGEVDHELDCLTIGVLNHIVPAHLCKRWIVQTQILERWQSILEAHRHSMAKHHGGTKAKRVGYKELAQKQKKRSFCISLTSPASPLHLVIMLSALMNRAIASSPLMSVAFIGNPGVGKSTLHNALGANFANGFSSVQGMEVGEPQLVQCNGRNLRLVDIPGINDNSGGDGGDSTTDAHLLLLKNRLNDGNTYVIFFVITPRNGRIDPSDLALIQLVLSKMNQGPIVGLILTQVLKKHFESVKQPTYQEQVMDVLRQGGANLSSLSKNRALVLRTHEDDFSPQEVRDIQDYILSFEPKQVHVESMVSSLWKRLLAFFQKLNPFK